MAGVVQGVADLDGAGRRVEVRLDELDLARERLARERLDGRLDRLPVVDQADVLVDLGLDPDGVEVGDLEHRVAFRHLLALDDVLLEHVPADRREDRDREVGLALLEDLVDLGLGDPPALELLGRQRGPSPAGRPGASGPAAVCGRTRRSADAGPREQLLDRLVQLGAVELGQGLARLDVLAGEVDVELLDPRLARDLGDDVGHPPLVERDVADGRQGLGQRGVGDLGGLDPRLRDAERGELRRGP